MPRPGTNRWASNVGSAYRRKAVRQPFPFILAAEPRYEKNEAWDLIEFSPEAPRRIDTAENVPQPSASADNENQSVASTPRRQDKDVGGYDPSEKIAPEREVNVGDPQIKVKEKERSVTSILKELAAIQQQGPQKYCILGTRHCSYLHQQIIELL